MNEWAVGSEARKQSETGSEEDSHSVSGTRITDEK